MAATVKLTDVQVEDIVRRSYQYVAMYNVNNKFAMDPSNPLGTGGWNRVKANTTLADHTLKAIPRPNNDTLYVIAMLDPRNTNDELPRLHSVVNAKEFPMNVRPRSNCWLGGVGVIWPLSGRPK